MISSSFSFKSQAWSVCEVQPALAAPPICLLNSARFQYCFFYIFQVFKFQRGHPCHSPPCTPASSACMVPMLVLCCLAARQVCLIWLHVNSHRYPILSVTRLSALYSRHPVPKCAGLHRCACVQRSSWFFPVSIPPSRATTCEPSFHNELRAAAMLDLPSVHIRQL